MANDICLKLYNIDGSLLHGYLKDCSPNEWLINYHYHFFQRELEQIKAEKFSKVIIGNASARQDHNSEEFNARLTTSSVFVLPLIQTYMQTQVTSDVVMDTFCMADIYGDKTPGESYLASLNAFFLKTSIGEHARWVTDHSNISTLYAHAHRVKALNINAQTIRIDYYCHRNDILENIFNFFNEHLNDDQESFLLPRGVSLYLYNICGTEKTTLYKTAIHGGGMYDQFYQWSVRYLCAISYYHYDRDNVRVLADRQINTILGLKKFHSKGYKGLSMSLGKHMLAAHYGFQLEIFEKLRNDFHSQGSLDFRFNKDTYTTGLELKSLGLIPPSYLWGDPILPTLKMLAEENVWQDQGTHFFSYSTPTAITKIKSKTFENFQQILDIVTESINTTRWRSSRTVAFYRLICDLNLLVTDEIRWNAIMSFCTAWPAKNAVSSEPAIPMSDIKSNVKNPAA